MATPPLLIIDDRAIGALKKDIRDLAADFAKNGKLKKPFERIRDEVMIPSIDENFVVGGRPHWEPISPDTYRNRKNTGGLSFEEAGLSTSASPLLDTGQMHRAATAKARFTINDNVMTYGNWPARRWFGVVHNVAEYASNAKIPHRPFTMFQPEDIADIQRIMLDWIEDMVERNLRRRYV